MCLKTNCKYIEIWEIKDDVKVALHYDTTNKPIFIQFWDYNLGLDEDYKLKSKKNKTRKNKRRISFI